MGGPETDAVLNENRWNGQNLNFPPWRALFALGVYIGSANRAVGISPI